MEFESQFPVSFLYLIFISVFKDSKDVVVVSLRENFLAALHLFDKCHSQRLYYLHLPKCTSLLACSLPRAFQPGEALRCALISSGDHRDDPHVCVSCAFALGETA